MKGAIIYAGKYGATKQYATWLGDELGLPVLEQANAGPEIIARFDYLLIGTSVYAGRTLNKEWLERNEITLKSKKLFFFVVCGTPSSETKKLEQLIEKNIPSQLMQPASVWFLRGRMIIKKLSWKDRMMLKIGAKLESNPEVKKNMMQDFDEVRKENLSTLVKAVMIFARSEQGTPQKLKGAGIAR